MPKVNNRPSGEKWYILVTSNAVPMRYFEQTGSSLLFFFKAILIDTHGLDKLLESHHGQHLEGAAGLDVATHVEHAADAALQLGPGLQWTVNVVITVF
jgi:hypothetical protein